MDRVSPDMAAKSFGETGYPVMTKTPAARGGGGQGILSRPKRRWSERVRRTPVEQREIRGGLSQGLHLQHRSTGPCQPDFDFYNTRRKHQTLNRHIPDQP